MARVKNSVDGTGSLVGRSFVCPGCKHHHVVYVEGAAPGGARWTFNGNYERPTFVPSLKVTIGPYSEHFGPEMAGKTDVCHSQITDGRIMFYGDCTHALVNQTVDLPEIAETPTT